VFLIAQNISLFKIPPLKPVSLVMIIVNFAQKAILNVKNVILDYSFYLQIKLAGVNALMDFFLTILTKPVNNVIIPHNVKNVF
jgi:hypothetical protein